MLDSIYHLTLKSLLIYFEVQRVIVGTTVVLAPFVKVFQKSISLQSRVGKYSYLHHRYLLGLAFIPRNPRVHVRGWG